MKHVQGVTAAYFLTIIVTFTVRIRNVGCIAMKVSTGVMSGLPHMHTMKEHPKVGIYLLAPKIA